MRVCAKADFTLRAVPEHVALAGLAQVDLPRALTSRTRDPEAPTRR